MNARSFFISILAALLVAACVPVTTPVPVPAQSPVQSPVGAPTPAPAGNVTPGQPPAPPATFAPAIPGQPTVPVAAVTPAVIPSGWQVYTNPEGFAISYPPAWKAEAEPDGNNGMMHTIGFKGPEGEVHLSWGVGFGGACPIGYTTVKVAQGDIQVCNGKNENGTEFWLQMSHPLPNAGFSGRALTSDAQPASRDVILKILSTLTFAPMPAAGATVAPPAPAPGATAAPATPSAPAGAGYADPFAYCAAVGTIDAPDARYAGPKTPGSILPVPLGAGTPSPFPEGSVYWRCMNGKVYTCMVGANIPCWAKADTSTTPNAGMQEFCKGQPDADFIPAVATGRETIYAWSCKNGAPVMGKQVLQVDAQGYPVEYWQEIPAPR